jgi:hypothetical protein
LPAAVTTAIFPAIRLAIFLICFNRRNDSGIQ